MSQCWVTLLCCGRGWFVQRVLHGHRRMVLALEGLGTGNCTSGVGDGGCAYALVRITLGSDVDMPKAQNAA